MFIRKNYPYFLFDQRLWYATLYIDWLVDKWKQASTVRENPPPVLSLRWLSYTVFFFGIHGQGETFNRFLALERGSTLCGVFGVRPSACTCYTGGISKNLFSLSVENFLTPLLLSFCCVYPWNS